MLQVIDIGYDEPAAKGCAKKDRLLFLGILRKADPSLRWG
jgi:hypothetical protein